MHKNFTEYCIKKIHSEEDEKHDGGKHIRTEEHIIMHTRMKRYRDNI